MKAEGPSEELEVVEQELGMVKKDAGDAGKCGRQWVSIRDCERAAVAPGFHVCPDLVRSAEQGTCGKDEDVTEHRSRGWSNGVLWQSFTLTVTSTVMAHSGESKCCAR